MNARRCDQAEILLAAVRTGRTDERLRAHALSCPECADVVLVGAALRELAEAERPSPPPATAAQSWWRATRRLRNERLDRATRPIRLVRRLAWLAGAGALGALVVRSGPALASWLGSLAASRDALWPVDLALLTASLFVAVLILGLYTVLADDG